MSENNKIFNIGLGLFCLALVGGGLLFFVLPGLGRVSGLDLAVLIMLLLGAWYQLDQNKYKKISPVMWFIGIFVVFALISLINSLRLIPLPEILLSGLFLLKWIIYAGLFWWAYLLNQQQRNSVFIFIGLTMGVIVLLGLIQLVVFPNLGFLERLGWDPHQHRLVSTFLDPNLLGGLLVVGLFFPLHQWFNQSTKKHWRWLWLLIIILINTAIFLTYSRSALLALVVFWIIIGLRYWRIAVLGLIFVGLVIVVSPRLQTRVMGMFELDATAQHRLDSWQDAITIIKQEPILGVGYNTLTYTKSQYIYQPQSKAYSGFDSSLLTLAVTTGIVGLSAYLIMVLAIIVNLIKLIWARHQFITLGALASTLALMVDSVFVNSWLYGPVLAVWWIIVGLALSKNVTND